MTAEDQKSIKNIKALVAKKDYDQARKETETLERRHTADNCNLVITDIVDGLANKDDAMIKSSIDDFIKWYDLDSKNI